MDESSFQAAGLYDPDGPTASDRLALLGSSSSAGPRWPRWQEADADGCALRPQRRSGRLRSRRADSPRRGGGAVGDDRGADPAAVLAEGIPVDDATLLPAFVVDDAAFEMGMELFGDEATLAFTRVVGASVSRIVDAAISLFYGDDSPTLPVDATELERAR
jgi:hypothetical protein